MKFPPQKPTLSAIMKRLDEQQTAIDGVYKTLDALFPLVDSMIKEIRKTQGKEAE